MAMQLTDTWFSIFLTQLVGLPLYCINRDWYYAYMAMTKRSFAIITSCVTSIWGPTTIRISGDASVMKQIEATPEGGVQFNFPERIVLIANHQVGCFKLLSWQGLH
jgi:1-acyl-sn-glycerol-3-phosphate acyltransferase